MLSRIPYRYQKKSRKLLFDDFTCILPTPLLINAIWHVDALSYTLEQLSPDTEYRYRVPSPDKNRILREYHDFSTRYVYARNLLSKQIRGY